MRSRPSPLGRGLIALGAAQTLSRVGSVIFISSLTVMFAVDASLIEADANKAGEQSAERWRAGGCHGQSADTVGEENPSHPDNQKATPGRTQQLPLGGE